MEDYTRMGLKSGSHGRNSMDFVEWAKKRNLTTPKQKKIFRNIFEIGLQ